MMTSEISAILSQTANHVPAELLSRWRSLTALQGSPCRIGCIGLLKAGKSSLCNALCNSLDDSLFAVGDIRTTTKIQEHAVDGFSLLDSPGLDCNDHDTQTTLQLIESLDIILYVHNLNCGGFDGEEKKFFQRLMAEDRQRKLFLKKTVWVLSKLDECAAENIPLLQDKISAQIALLTGYAPQHLYCVGSRSYKKGMQQNKQLLIRASRIPEFMQKLHALTECRQQEIEEERQALARQVAQKVLQSLSNEAKQRSQQLEKLEEAVDKTKSAFISRINRLRSNLHAQLDKIDQE